MSFRSRTEHASGITSDLLRCAASRSARRATIRRRLGFAVLLALVATPSPALSEPGEQTLGFERGGHRFELRVTAREATLQPGLLGQLLLYTVRRDGVFVHPESAEGGRLLGCVRSVAASQDYLFDAFPAGSQPLGWMLGTGAICGNTSSLLVTLVLPAGSAGSPTYAETTFEAKARPETRGVGDDLEVWSVRQWWGKGGTGTSVFVPERRRVLPDGRVHLAPLDPDWSTWHPSVTGTSFGGAFVAGLEQENAPLMRQAVLKLMGDDSAKPCAWSQAVGLPSTHQGLLELVEAVADVTRAKDRLAAALHGP